MVLKLDDHLVWDSWYAHDGERWHAFFLKADRSIGDPELQALERQPRSLGQRRPDGVGPSGHVLSPSEGPAWDDYTTWTGSVVQDDTGLWHLFYTGSSHAEDCLYQRIGHATSPDLHDWTRVGDGLCLDLVGPARSITRRTSSTASGTTGRCATPG